MLKITISQNPNGYWDKFIESHPKGKIYFLSKWAELVQTCFQKETRFLSIFDNQELVGVLPLTIFRSKLFGNLAVSLPYVNYGGMLTSKIFNFSIVEEELQRLRKELDVDYIELRCTHALDTQLSFKDRKVTFYLDLPDDPEIMFSQFKAKLRSQIRKPQKERMYVKIGKTDILHDFYAVFSHNMHDLGTPVYSKRFFAAILNTFPENSHVVVTYTESKIPVAAAFLIEYNGMMEIPWASSIRKYNRFSPNMLLYWESIKLAIQHKCAVFDFGRCSKDSGTYRFKRQWGPVEKQLYWYYILPEDTDLPELNPENPKYKLAIKVWQKLPLFVANNLGPHIVKNIP